MSADTELAEDRFRRFFELGLVGMAITSPTKGMLDVNEELCRILGYSCGELLQKKWTDLTHPDDLASDVANFNRVMAGEIDGYSMEKRFIHHDGQIVYTVISVKCLRDAEHNVRYFMALIQNITKRKLAERALQDAKVRLDVAIQGSNIGIWEVAMPDGVLLEGRISYVNVWEHLGRDPSAAPTTVSEALALSHPEDRDATYRAAEAYLAGQTREFAAECRGRHVDGSYHWMLLKGVAIRNAAGNPVQFIGTVQDISDRVKMQEDLRQAKEAAEAASRAKVAFMANVSHEMRSPLNIILGMAEIMLRTGANEQQRRDLGTIMLAAENMTRFINDLLDFEKVNAGKLQLESAEFSLAGMIEHLMRAMTPLAQSKGIQLRSELGPDIPGAVIGDSGRLSQLLLNLMTNAIKFTEHGEVLLRVGAPAIDGASTPPVRFEVIDTGIGIALENQQLIFEPFEQIHSPANRRNKGTGLGLAIASQLAELMGANITVESEPGRGSTFSFTIPFRVAACTMQ